MFVGMVGLRDGGVATGRFPSSGRFTPPDSMLTKRCHNFWSEIIGEGVKVVWCQRCPNLASAAGPCSMSSAAAIPDKTMYYVHTTRLQTTDCKSSQAKPNRVRVFCNERMSQTSGVKKKKEKKGHL
jgi:hypothetical protein